MTQKNEKTEKSNFFNQFNFNDNQEDNSPIINKNNNNNKNIKKRFLHSKTINSNKFKKFEEKYFDLEQKEEDKEEEQIEIENSPNKNLKKRKIIKCLPDPQTPDNLTDPKVLFGLIEDFESKKMELTPGYCFGEWGLLYNIPRTTSIYCIEDTHVFYLEKKYFDKILLKKFRLNDLKKIQFIYDRLPILKNHKNSNFNFEHILTKITPFFFDEGDIVYTPYDNANTLYLIYLGECYLCEMPIKTINKIDYLQKKDKLVRVNTITEGGMVGLESCLPEKKYEHCLYVVQNFTILLKLEIDYFQNIVDNFKESLIGLYKNHKNIMKEFHNRNEKVRKEFNFKFQNLKLKKREFFKEFYKDKNIINGKNDKDIIHRINSSRFIKISETRNIFQQYNKKKLKKTKNNKKNLKLNINYFQKNNKQNNVETESLKIPKILLKSPIKLENNIEPKNYNTLNAKENKKMKIIHKNISLNNENELKEKRKNSLNTKGINLNFFRKNSNNNLSNKKLFSRNIISNSPIKNNNFDSITNFSSTKTKSNKSPINFRKKLYYYPQIKNMNNASYLINNSNLSNSIVSKQNNISHKRISSFDSGLFNIPFVTSFLNNN
jgi:hypothetical protein